LQLLNRQDNAHSIKALGSKEETYGCQCQNSLTGMGLYRDKPGDIPF